jgi:hypothetical protein
LLDDAFGLVDDRMSDAKSGRGPTQGDRGDMRFHTMTGILVEEDRARFERALFRATRGNCYVRFAPIDAPMPTNGGKEGVLVAKTVFIVFYKSSAIEAKARRLCDAFGARRYSVPADRGGLEGARAVDAAVEANRQDIADARAVLIKNREVGGRVGVVGGGGGGGGGGGVLAERHMINKYKMSTWPLLSRHFSKTQHGWDRASPG